MKIYISLTNKTLVILAFLSSLALIDSYFVKQSSMRQNMCASTHPPPTFPKYRTCDIGSSNVQSAARYLVLVSDVSVSEGNWQKLPRCEALGCSLPFV